jgi:predicted nucleic acid-binding protein
VLLEIGYSAPASDYADIVGRARRTMTMIDLDKSACDRALEVQALLATESQHRTAKVFDIMVAACAETKGLIVLHYDHDYDAIAEVTGQPTMWVVPRGSIA